MGATGTNHVQLYNPFPEHVQRHAQIVKELKERDARDEHDKIQDREELKRSLQSGEQQTSSETKRIQKRSGMSSSFVIVLITRRIHSKRRNRLGQDLVECLVRAHTNLKLEHRLDLYETGQLPWDIDMVVEEPLSDDEDDPPHSVYESESESESEKRL